MMYFLKLHASRCVAVSLNLSNLTLASFSIINRTGYPLPSTNKGFALAP